MSERSEISRITPVIVCPFCKKEIRKQAEIEIPTNTDREVTNGSLIFKDGNYFLILAMVVTCPHCRQIFGLDTFFPTLLNEDILKGSMLEKES